MKIEQKPKFQPITITLETAEEAKTFWKLLTSIKPKEIDVDTEVRVIRMRNKISDWFSNEAQLGGNP